jgi:beta-mannosidase
MPSLNIAGSTSRGTVVTNNCLDRTAPTWASIEPDGRWKVLFYRAKDIFQPVIGYPYYNLTTGDLEVWVTSDLWTPTRGEVKLSWMDWSGKPLSGPNYPASRTLPSIVGAINSTQIFQTNMLNDYENIDLSDVLLQIDVSSKGVRPNDLNNTPKTYTHTSFFHAESLQKSKLQDPGLHLVTSRQESGSFEFKVTATKSVAAWVWLDYPLGVQGYFSDNGFWLSKGESKTIQFTVKNDWTHGKWIEGVKVRSIWNNTLID